MKANLPFIFLIKGGKRGGGGGKSQVADVALQYNSAQANTAAPPGNSICL